MKISKSEAKKVKLGKTKIYSYPSPSRAISTAYIEVTDRHPLEKNKFFIEKDLHLSFFITKGEGTFIINSDRRRVSEQDSLIIYPGQKYAIEGNLSYVVTTTPSYYPEQNEIV